MAGVSVVTDVSVTSVGVFPLVSVAAGCGSAIASVVAVSSTGTASPLSAMSVSSVSSLFSEDFKSGEERKTNNRATATNPKVPQVR